MKKKSIISAVAILTAILIVSVLSRHRGEGSGSGKQNSRGVDSTPKQPADKRPSAAGTVPASNDYISVSERRLMTDADRTTYLESLGYVPADAERKDWDLAQKTSWWGKPLDPTAFWRGRVVWCDAAARAAALARGRIWPPIPYKDPVLDPILAKYPDDDGIHDRGLGEQTTDVHAARSSREDAFWLYFMKTHPKPPEQLEAWQLNQAENLLRLKRLEQPNAIGTPPTQKEVAQVSESAKRDATVKGYPPELLSEDALFWAYVVRKNAEIQQLPAGSPLVGPLLTQSLVDTNLLTRPLSQDELSNANASKIGYLRRLRNEKADDSYINAYLQAWNLSAAQVFTQTNR